MLFNWPWIGTELDQDPIINRAPSSTDHFLCLCHIITRHWSVHCSIDQSPEMKHILTSLHRQQTRTIQIQMNHFDFDSLPRMRSLDEPLTKCRLAIRLWKCAQRDDTSRRVDNEATRWIGEERRHGQRFASRSNSTVVTLTAAVFEHCRSMFTMGHALCTIIATWTSTVSERVKQSPARIGASSIQAENGRRRRRWRRALPTTFIFCLDNGHIVSRGGRVVMFE